MIDPLDAFLYIFMMCIFITFFIGFIWLVTADHYRRKKHGIHTFVKDQEKEREKEMKSGNAGNYFSYTSKPQTSVMLPRPEYSALYLPMQ